MQIKDVYDLIARFEQSNMTELSLEMEGVSFHGKKGGTPAAAAVQEAPAVKTEAFQMPVQSQEEKTSADRVVVEAQIAGTFYRAPSPDDEPFVKVGQQVKKGDTLGLMEAMKMMSNVVAPIDGIVAEIPVENSTLVSFGAPLFYLE